MSAPSANETTIADCVAAWCALDREAAFLPGDRAVVDATEAPRALIVELVLERAPHADLFHACSTLGRLFAERGASPTLAASAIAGAQRVIPNFDADSARAALAALVEGYVAVRVDAARLDATARWEFPGCGVPLADAGVALAAGFPEDDDDALAAWAARVAKAVVRAGFRRAVVAGGALASAALFDALELAGVKVRTTSPPAPIGRR